MRGQYDLHMDGMTERLDLAGQSNAPRYNIQAVEKSTGLSARTLRSWERRYGVPSPHRDEGGRRLYSDRDIAVIRWIRGRVEQGIAVSRAIALLDEGDSPSDRAVLRLEALQTRLLQAIDWMDEEEVRRILSLALPDFPLESVVLELIQPVLYRVGELWQSGRLSIASEHFGTHLLRTTLADQFRRAGETPRSHHIMVGCAPGELHDVGALVFALFLRRAGFPVTYLGASLEAESLMGDLQRLQPAALCLSATTAEAAAEVAALYRPAGVAFPGLLAYGGRGFELNGAIEGGMPGVALGTDALAAIDALKNLL
jgi:DNA-binding transcriptional MerR regulator